MEPVVIIPDCPKCGSEVVPHTFSSGALGYRCVDCGRKFKARQVELADDAGEDWRHRDIIIDDATRQQIQTRWGGSISGDENPDRTIQRGGISSSRVQGDDARPGLFSTVLKLPNFDLEPDSASELKAAASKAHTELVVTDRIGEGGMGIVFKAEQRSLKRDIAVKRIKDASASNMKSVGMFLSEAYAAAYLDHPNIIPVHELGTDTEGRVFYSMKLIDGRPWEDLLFPTSTATREIAERMTIRDHLDILLKVCDAMAFAHSRGIIHRDLKPENVMVGAFNEVLVLDWGLAVSTDNATAAISSRIENAARSNHPCGTPSYMPPEMATGDSKKLGPASDVYLLGAILFTILFRRPPHSGSNVWEILLAASKNVIAEPNQVNPEAIPYISTLSDTMMTALETEPSERFETADEFALELRKDIEHIQSIQTSKSAISSLIELKMTISTGLQSRHTSGQKVYPQFAQIIALLSNAIEAWPGNVKALRALSDARCLYARFAMEKGDFTLAEAQLGAVESTADAGRQTKRRLSGKRLSDVDVVRLRAQLKSEKQRLERNQFMFWGLSGLGAVLLIGLLITAILSFRLNSIERDRAVKAQEEAQKQADLAKKAKDIALLKSDEAEKSAEAASKNEEKAKLSLSAAEKSQKDAELSAQKAEKALQEKNESERKMFYQQYSSNIQLADAMLRGNDYRRARAVLKECESENFKTIRGWEQQYLKQRASPEHFTYEAGQSWSSISYSPDGKRLIVRMTDQRYDCLDPDTGAKKSELSTPYDNQRLFPPCWDKDGNAILISTDDQRIYVWFDGRDPRRDSFFKPADDVAANLLNDRLIQTAKYCSQNDQLFLALQPRPASAMYQERTLGALSVYGWVEVWDVQKAQLKRSIDFKTLGVHGIYGFDNANCAVDTTFSTMAIPGGIGLSFFRLDQQKGVLSHTYQIDEFINAAYIDKKKSYIAIGDNEGDCSLWLCDQRQYENLSNKRERAFPINKHRDRATAVSISDDLTFVASASSDGSVAVYNRVQKKYDKPIFGIESEPSSLVISPDNSKISVLDGQTVRSWDRTIDKFAVRFIQLPRPRINRIEFSQDGTRILSGGHGDALFFHDVKKMEPNVAQIVHGSTTEIRFFDVADDKRRVIACGYDDRLVHLFDVQAKKFIRKSASPLLCRPRAIQFVEKDFSIAVAGEESKDIYILNADTLITAKDPIKLHTAPVRSLAASSAGRYLVSGGDDERIAFWDLQLGKEYRPAIRMPGAGSIHSLTFSSDDKYLAIGTRNGHILMYDFAQLKQIGEPKPKWSERYPWGAVNDIRFFKDNERLVAGGSKGVLRIFHPETGLELLSVKVMDEPATIYDCLTSVAVSPDEKTIAVGHYSDGKIRLFSVQ
ncbi:MAG: protein kinase [Planctomycetota bacterium]